MNLNLAQLFVNFDYYFPLQCLTLTLSHSFGNSGKVICCSCAAPDAVLKCFCPAPHEPDISAINDLCVRSQRGAGPEELLSYSSQVRACGVSGVRVKPLKAEDSCVVYLSWYSRHILNFVFSRSSSG